VTTAAISQPYLEHRRAGARTWEEQVDPLVFVTEATDGRTELLVNFGVFASRDATRAEIDQLGSRLLPFNGQLTIVSEQRYEFGATAEATVHQVRVTLERDNPSQAGERDDVTEVLVRQWARSCIANRHPSISDDLQDLF
jgi:hypothetical protein